MSTASKKNKKPTKAKAKLTPKKTPKTTHAAKAPAKQTEKPPVKHVAIKPATPKGRRFPPGLAGTASHRPPSRDHRSAPRQLLSARRCHQLGRT